MLRQNVGAESRNGHRQPSHGRYVDMSVLFAPQPDADCFAEVICEKVQDGASGDTKEMQYTQSKIVGNGSFGVVFQIKLVPSNEDAAIKRVLQDKRFKASCSTF